MAGFARHTVTAVDVDADIGTMREALVENSVPAQFPGVCTSGAAGRMGEGDLEAEEAAALAFDPEDDFVNVIPMPPSIPAKVREALARLFATQFRYYSELDEWLHRPHPALGAATPCERIVDGDGIGVLRALLRSGARRWPRRRKAGTSADLRLLR